MRVQIIAVVRPLQFSAKRSRMTAQHVPRDRELKQVKLFIRVARLKCAFSEPVHPKRCELKACLRGRSHIAPKNTWKTLGTLLSPFFQALGRLRSGGVCRS